MTFLYILHSQTTGRFYIGVSESLDRPLLEHQQGQTPSTRGRGPWVLVYTESYPTRSAVGRGRLAAPSPYAGLFRWGCAVRDCC